MKRSFLQGMVAPHSRPEGIDVSGCRGMGKRTPDIVEAILDGKQGAEVTLAQALEPFPLEWKRQIVDSEL